MSYWIARNGQKMGPYSPEDVQGMLQSGGLTPADLAWKEGMAQWTPLAQVMTSGAPPPAAAPQYGAPPPASVPPYGYSPQYGAAPVRPTGFSPMPPDLHWGLVWLFGFLTAGIFIIVWLFMEASYVKKLDPQNNSMTMLIVGLVLFPLAGIFFLVALFGMRRSLLNYYNLTEPIGLRLSGGMTFFFGILYFQHHFSRICAWKRTGVLLPQ